MFSLTDSANAAPVAPTPAMVQSSPVTPAAGLTGVRLRPRSSWKGTDVLGPSSAGGTVAQQRAVTDAATGGVIAYVLGLVLLALPVACANWWNGCK